MRSMRRKVLANTFAAILGVSGLSGPGVALASSDEDPTAGEMFADAVAVRPLGLVASAVGAATWVVSLPFTLLGGNAGEAGEKMVVGPLKYTFVRPLGHMDEDATSK